MKTEFHSLRKNATQIIICALIIPSFFLLSLILLQKASIAWETSESVIVSFKSHGKLNEAMELTDKYINNCSKNVTYSWGYNEKGCIFTLLGEYTKAIYAFQESLRYSDGSSDDFITLLNMGTLQHSLGDYADAISYFDEAIIRMDNDDSRRYWLKMHVAWSGFYLSQGDTMTLKQVYNEVEPMLREIERHLNQFNKGKAYFMASRIAYQLGKHKEAIKLSKKYVKQKDSNSAKLSLAANLLYLENEAEANTVFSNIDIEDADNDLLALWYWLNGDELQAKSNLEGYSNDVEREKAWRLIRHDEILPYDIWKDARRQKWFVELIGPMTTDYPNAATYRNNLGAVWKAKGSYDKAIEYYEKALNSDLENLGEDHPNVATYRNNLGVAWNAKGEHDKAIEYLEKALKSDLKTFGEKHSNVATYRNNLGTAFNAKGEYDKAIEHLEKALSVIQVRLGKDHPDTKILKSNLRLAKEESNE
mgnify:CR=1 FL=1